LVCPKNENEHWTLLIPHATTVLYVVRNRMESWSEIVTELVRIGAEFYPVTVGTADANFKAERRECAPVGIRDIGFRAEAVDYAVYVARLVPFLRSPRGHVALYGGGIAARLARHYIELPVEAVYDAPLPTVANADEMIRLKNSEETAVFVHTLTAREKDFVCGVYLNSHSEFCYLSRSCMIINTEAEQLASDGETVAGEVFARMSWWPTAASWWISARNVLWWTPDCEDWFSGRMLRFHLGTWDKMVRSSGEWKADLRDYNPRRKVAFGLENVCLEYLSQHLD
jgi:hypothetical protein